MVGKGRKKSVSSRFERELKKLECSVNYYGTGCESGLDREGGVIASGYK